MDNSEQRMGHLSFFLTNFKDIFKNIKFLKKFSKLHRKANVTTLIIRQRIANTVDELRQMLMAIVKTGLTAVFLKVMIFFPLLRTRNAMVRF